MARPGRLPTPAKAAHRAGWAAGGLVVFAGGFFCGWRESSPVEAAGGGGGMPAAAHDADGSRGRSTPLPPSNDDLGIEIDGLDGLLASADTFRALKVFHGLLRDVDPEACPEILARILQVSDVEARDAYLWLLAERWAQLDPDGAAGALALDPRSAEAGGRAHAIWARTEPDAALASALALDGARPRSAALRHIVSDLAGRDPRAALGQVEDIPAEAVRPSRRTIGFAGAFDLRYSYRDRSVPENAFNLPWIRSHIFEKWAREDPAAASLASGQLAGGAERWDAYVGIADALAATDPAAGAEWVESLPDGGDKTAAQMRVFWSWLQEDAFAAAAYAAQRSQSLVGRARFAEAAYHLLTKRGGAFALDWIAASGAAEGAKESAYLNLFKRFGGEIPPGWIDSPQAAGVAANEKLRSAFALVVARHDTERAKGLIDLIADPAQRAEAVSSLVSILAETDPAAAAAWLGSNPSVDIPDWKTRSTFFRWARSDPEAAGEAAATLLPAQAVAALGGVASAYAAQSPTEALRWGAAHLDGETRSGFQESVFAGWLDYDLHAAGDFLISEIGFEENPFLATSLFGVYSALDPEAAAGYAADRLTDEQLDAVAPAIGANWIRSDPLGASGWIDRLGPGEGRDQVVAMLCGAITARDPEAAVGWAETITDPARRAAWIAHANRALAGEAGDSPPVARISPDWWFERWDDAYRTRIREHLNRR